jgi:hypothetical protein
MGNHALERRVTHGTERKIGGPRTGRSLYANGAVRAVWNIAQDGKQMAVEIREPKPHKMTKHPNTQGGVRKSQIGNLKLKIQGGQASPGNTSVYSVFPVVPK